MNNIISKHREELKHFYETSTEYKGLLYAHDRNYLSTYINIVNKYAKPDSMILDLGCGNGLSSNMLSEYGHNVIGTDISSFFLADSAKLQNNRLKYCVCDVLDLPFKDCVFDVVCSNELIEHVFDAGRAIAEMIRVLKSNGILVIVGPNLCSPFWAIKDLINMIIGRNGRYLWAETKTQALKWGYKNLIISIKKRISRKVDFIYREPDIKKAIAGGDSDSVYYASPIDIEKFMKINGMKIVRICESTTLRGRIIARLFPRFGPYISIIARKK